MLDFTIKIGAAAGQGAFITGRIIGKLFARAGYYVFGYPEYPSLIRGGHNAYQIRISSKPIYSPKKENNVILAVNKDAILFHKDSLTKDGYIIADELAAKQFKEKYGETKNIVEIPVVKKLKEINAPMKMANIAYIGSLLSALNFPLEPLLKLIEETFSKKGKEIVEKNQEVAKTFYNLFKEVNIANISPRGEKKLYISGNEAAGLGAISAGLKLYAGYPMTPASSLLHFLIGIKEKANIAVIQSEDEISAANIAVGASFAGIRAMTGTSGGGFSLMTETVGMAALAETPIVFYLAQRVGPSTGMPTWTEQADLFQALGASQGEFPRILVSPITIEDSYYITGEALNLAEEYQTPVIILTDKFIAESHSTVGTLKPIKINRGKLTLNIDRELKPGERFKRYATTEDGISPRTIPTVKNGMHVATSYEHREDSFTTEDFSERKKQVEKRLKKLEKARKESWPPHVEGDGEITIITWGSQYGPIKEGLEKSNIKATLLAFRWLYPLDEKKIKPYIKEKVIIFENNSTGLFEKLLRMETDIKATARVLKYTGRPFFPHQVEKALKELEKSEFQGTIRMEEDFERYEFYAPWRY